jgi:hypothetical protein
LVLFVFKINTKYKKKKEELRDQYDCDQATLLL